MIEWHIVHDVPVFSVMAAILSRVERTTPSGRGSILVGAFGGGLPTPSQSRYSLIVIPRLIGDVNTPALLAKKSCSSH